MKPNSTIEPDVRQGVSPSLDPGNLNQFAAVLEKSGTGRRALAAGQRAMTEMHTAMAEIDDATRALAGRTGRVTTRPGGFTTHSGDVRMGSKGLRAFSGHEPKLVDAAKQRFDAVGRGVQQQVNILTDVIADNERLMDEALADAIQPVLAGDIRRHVASMDDTDRFAFLHDRVKRGDKQTVTAVLAAPGYLSGLNDDARASLLDAARRMFAPDAHATHTAASRTYDTVRRAIDTFVVDYHAKLKPLGPGESDVAGKIAAVRGGAA